MDIIENNKLIAEFMGWYLKHNQITSQKCWFNDNKNYHYKKEHTFENFKTDWNWLMEVIQKIEGLSHEQKVIDWSRQNKSIFDFKLTESKIEAVYNACITFIEWYNLAQKKN